MTTGGTSSALCFDERREGCDAVVCGFKNLQPFIIIVERLKKSGR